MSTIKRDFDRVMALAESIQDESVFQKHQLYKTFKAKYQSQVAQAQVNTETLFTVLSKQNFYNENVFWGKKILDNQRLGNKETRAGMLYVITISFHMLNDYENSFEYGKKSLEHDIQPNDVIETQNKRTVLQILRKVSLVFQKKQDAVEYEKEILKLDVIRCNKKEFEKFYLLQSYHNLIELQIANGDFKSAQKTIDKHLSIFNLNSMNPKEVLRFMAKEDYRKILPGNHLLQPQRSEMDQNEFLDHFSTDFHSLISWCKRVQFYHFLGKICWQKYEIFSHFGLENNICHWAYMALQIVDDLLFHIQIQKQVISESDINSAFKAVRIGFNKVTPVKISDELSVKSFIVEKISITLLLADHDHRSRERLFSQLAKLLLLPDTEDTDAGYTDTEDTDSEKTDTEDTDPEHSDTLIDKNKVSWYIAESLRTNDRLDVLKVMPFIQFCLKSLDENISAIEGADSDNNVDIKVQLMTLKNSLSIMNHFETM